MPFQKHLFHCVHLSQVRQLHLQHWIRQQALDSGRERDRAKEREQEQELERARLAGTASSVPLSLSPPRQLKSAYQLELQADPSGIGCAYGGVDPGKVGARGHPVEQHKVHFSIAKAGTYSLHVALRAQSVPLPGSPFQLRVVAGASGWMVWNPHPKSHL